MPTLSKIHIEYYRGFYAERSISFAVPNGRIGSGFSILVGPNNSGKSTVINALRSIVSGPRQIDLEHRHPNRILRIAVSDSERRQKALSNPDLGAVTVLEGDKETYPTANDVRIVPSRRSWSPYTGSARIIKPDYWNYRLNTTEAEDSQLVARLADLSSEQKMEFNGLLKELLPQLNSWRIELSRGQTFIQYETYTGARHAADLFGDGMVSIFRIALSLFDSSNEQIVIIDEPELSLHPQAQKTLASVLARFAADRQVVVTTHSPYFVNWSDISNGAQVWRLTQRRDGVSVKRLAPATLDALNGLMSDWQKPNLLDAVAREIFFADEVVFLEGQEDVGLFRKFAQERGLPPLPAFGYGAGGVGNIPYFLRMAEDLGIPSAAVFDGDHEEEKKKAAAEYPNSLIELLRTPDIRDKPRRDDRGKELDEIDKVGVFERSGTIRPEYDSYLQDLIKRIHASLIRRE